ncbi:hypothetical protein [Undibacterium pigrum]|uniref:Outer membrane lipoprotein-sorting protein n=1 Tax=Undibacterium pigrum TaxID=401470 RepID=A0A318J014_9BURK|nr:hypothetical protein [Undibacterium pigrum]PXX39991.1 hypothetical protein DFR42_109102 [Undibacterium pigrum]
MSVLLRGFIYSFFLVCWCGAAIAQPAKSSPSASIPTPASLALEAIMQRHLAALGDFSKVQSRRARLRIIGLAPFEIPTTVEAKRPNLLRRDVSVQGQLQVSSYDGKDAWKIDPFLPSGKRAVDMPTEELPAMLEESYFDGILVAAQKQGFPLQYAGLDTQDGRRVHVLKVSVPATGESTIYLDADSFLEIKRLQKRPVMGRMTELEVYTSDYRMQDGLMMAYRFEIGTKGASATQRMSMVVDAVENNPAIALSRFQRTGN